MANPSETRETAQHGKQDSGVFPVRQLIHQSDRVEFLRAAGITQYRVKWFHPEDIPYCGVNSRETQKPREKTSIKIRRSVHRSTPAVVRH